jgi:hypothetical protein
MQALLLSAFVAAAAGCRGRVEKEADPQIAPKIIAAETTALERWARGDPYGYLEILAGGATGFSPWTAGRIDGLRDVNRLATARAGKDTIDQYKMAGARVQLHGDAAVLSYLLFIYRRQAGGVLVRTESWKCTRVYARIGGRWRIVHGHRSALQP